MSRRVLESLLPTGALWEPKYIESEPVLSQTELVTNGTFDSDLGGWNVSNGSSVFIAWNASGYMTIDMINPGGSIFGTAEQQINVVFGKTYQFSFEVSNSYNLDSDGKYIKVYVGSSPGNNDLYDSGELPNLDISYTANFVASSNVAWIRFFGFSTTGVTAAGAGIDNVSLREFVTNKDGDLYRLLDGMGVNHEKIRDFLASLAYIRDPQQTPILSDLEKEYGVITNLDIPEQERRNSLDGIVYARKSPGTRDFLQQQLHAAGFSNLYVYDNSPAVDPEPIISVESLIYCGGTTAECGHEDALCAYNTGGELIVNGKVYDYNIVYILQCGATTAECGHEDALSGNYSTVDLGDIEYVIPDKLWFFSETFISERGVERNGGTINGVFGDIVYGYTSQSTGDNIQYYYNTSLASLSIICDVDAPFISGVTQYVVSVWTASSNYFSFGINNDASTTAKNLFVRSTTAGKKTSTATTTPGRHQYAVTIDASGNINFYVDGVKLGATVTGWSFGTLQNELYIGALFSGSGPTQGTIYDLKLYDIELTQQQIQNYVKDETLRLWSKIFFIGGSPEERDPVSNEITSIPRANVNREKREALKKIVLKYKPMHSWAGLVVSYI